MKKVLIISPYFPPSNAADMHRIRMSLPYFEEFGWKAEIVTVNPAYSDMVKDSLLLHSVDKSVKVHTVKALPKKWTSKLGLGSIALRSLWFYKNKVDQILTATHFDLIYFSTTQFPVCILGAYWKQKFSIPYVIDMQDPWHSTYYLNKPKDERPAKYWFSYRLNKYLEPLAMKYVDGIISVSEAYIQQLKNSYADLADVPTQVLPFGYFKKDFDIAIENDSKIRLPFLAEPSKINLVYIGRGGFDMIPAIHLIFSSFKSLITNNPEIANAFKFHFVGTSYAPKGTGKPTFLPLAEKLGISSFVNEITDRISLYETLKGLHKADGLIIPGSNDPGYTASKIYPYILAEKPILALFQKSSSAYTILSQSGTATVTDLNDDIKRASNEIINYFLQLFNKNFQVNQKWNFLEAFSAKNMTRVQCDFFNKLT